MDCPYCGSDKVRMINTGFPKTFECMECKRIFSNPNPAYSEE